MVIEEIISELDKFITKYKERKDSAEKGISLRNNIKQALTEKGIQGADALDDSAIVERIKILSSSGNATVEGTQGNNSINETFSQKVIQILKENHYPFLNSEDDNIEKFTEFMKKKAFTITALRKSPKVLIENNTLAVSVIPNDGLAVKVKYTIDNTEHEEVISQNKTFANVSKFTYRECDYYGNFSKEAEKTIYLNAYRQQLEHPENYTFSGDKYMGDRDEIAFTDLVDNSNYDILDFRDKNFYKPIASKKVKEINSEKSLDEDLESSLENVKLNGIIKIGLISDDSKLGLDSINSSAFMNLPKYIVYLGEFLSNLSSPRYSLMATYVEFENEYSLRHSPEVLTEREQQFESVHSAIYRWDATQNKYMFETVSTLEDWLKTHPLETL